MTEPLLTLRGVHKRYGPTHALRGVDLTLRRGVVLALVGENGAGKSTLVKVLTGVVPMDEGELRLDGELLDLASAQDAGDRGIVAVHQETVMFEELSVSENLFIGRQPRRWGLIDWPRMRRDAKAALELVGAPFSPDAPVRSLSLAERHLLEIARALSREARVVILDEPTAALSQGEIRDFYGLVRRLRDRGMGVIFITHKFDEIFAVADRYVVLRDGAHVGEGAVADAREPELVKLMAGRAIEQIYPDIPSDTGDVVLRVAGMNHPTEFADVGFSLRRGEILGFYGLIGAGRSEVMLALMGLNAGSRGEVEIDGRRVTIREPADAMAAGIAYVPEERQRQGGILAFPVQHNISLAGLARFANGPWLSPRREAALCEDMTQRLRIKAESGAMPLSGLSGGNQQKVVIAKWLCLAPRIVILDEPTKGIDVGAKQAVYQLIAELVAEGLAVILVSSELPEVMNLAHRAIVMRRGRVVAELARDAFDAEHFVAAASGLAWPHADQRATATDRLPEAA